MCRMCNNNAVNNKRCYDWDKGSCYRGSSCRFQHVGGGCSDCGGNGGRGHAACNLQSRCTRGEGCTHYRNEVKDSKSPTMIRQDKTIVVNGVSKRRLEETHAKLESKMNKVDAKINKVLKSVEDLKNLVTASNVESEGTPGGVSIENVMDSLDNIGFANNKMTKTLLKIENSINASSRKFCSKLDNVRLEVTRDQHQAGQVNVETMDMNGIVSVINAMKAEMGVLSAKIWDLEKRMANMPAQGRNDMW